MKRSLIDGPAGSDAAPAADADSDDRRRVEELQERWNDRSAPESTTTVPILFADAARATPDALALVDGDRRLTYRELSTKVAQLADRLRRADLPAEGVVAICMPRSAEMVIGVLASIVAGGAFVPVDPDWPAARRDRVLADSSTRIALVAGDDRSTLPVDTIAVDLDRWAFDELSPELPRLEITGSRLAYVIFTSGSTGTPKGAMIRHEAICERLVWQRDRVLMFGPGDASLFKAPLAFDISVNEILLPLISGGYIVVAAPGSEKDPEYLLDTIAAERVTYLYLVSSMLDALLALDLERAESAGSALVGVKHVWCGGEVLTPDLFDRFRRQLSTTLYHGYGPAEATIGVSHVIYRDHAERIATSIGRPNPHTQLYVLDKSLTPAPIGVGGELYAAGFLLGRGYIGSPALTASRFVANPFDANGSRFYRTGDLARWTADGSLEFLGRADNQVKIRGRRVELEEIEGSISRHPNVRRAVVVLTRSSSGADVLIGYVTAMPDATLTVDEVLAWCDEQLPDYMVPARIMILDSFPVNANGKVDRRALPAPTEPRSSAGVTPRTPIEDLLCGVFARTLGVESVGVEDDFYALGGDSIVAVTIALALRSEGYRLRSKDIITHGTPARLAELLENPETAAVDEDPSISAGPLIVLDDADRAEIAATGAAVHTVLPVTSVQSGIYFHSTAAAGADPYVVQQIIELVGPLDAAALQRATHFVVRRHQALAAGFHITRSGTVVSTIDATDAPEFRSQRFDAEDTPHGGTDSAIDRYLAELAERDRERGFDLARPPLMRYTLVALDAEHHYLIQTVHHIIADGWSVALIWNDILTAYHGGSAPSDAPQLEEFLRWWSRRRRPDRELAAWTDYLAGVDGPTLVSDHLAPPPVPVGTSPAPHRVGAGFGRRSRELDREQRLLLTSYARSHAVSEGAILTLAWGILIGALTSRTDVVFGSTTAGRGEDVPGIDRIVGMLLNTVPTRVHWSHNDDIDDIVRRFAAAETSVLDHHHVPLVDVHTAFGVHELFDTLLSIENLRQPDNDPDAVLRLGSIEYVQAPHYRLTALVTLHDSVSVALTNDRSAIDDAVADRIADLYLRVVGRIVGGTNRRAVAFHAIAAHDVAERPVSVKVAPSAPFEPVAQRFARHVAASPESVAVLQGSDTWSYARLGARVNRLARLLIAEGVAPETRVALVLPRIPDMVVSLLAVITVGAAYVPVDPRHPADRIDHYLTDSAPAVVLTTRAIAAGLESDGVRPQGRLIGLDDPAVGERLAGLSPDPISAGELPMPLQPDHGAYVIYTSASTGKPKGVLGTAAGLSNRMAWATDRWRDDGRSGHRGGAVVDAIRPAKTSIGFIDGSTEILGALLTGRGLILVDESQLVDVERLTDLIADHRIAQITGVPTQLRAIAEVAGPRVEGVRQWICSGEALTSAVVRTIAAAAPTATVINSYGSSEVTGDVTYSVIPAAAHTAITIGTAVPGATTHLLDAWLRPVPPGVLGELYVGGIQVARGYVGRQDLTATRFVADPFGRPGDRLFRTGDLCRWSVDGELLYVGRRDFQVQVNGIRVELEEVERALTGVPGVAAAVAIVHRSAGSTRLVGYVTAVDGGDLDDRAVREAVANILPAQVVPTVIVLDTLPSTPSGKVDRSALPAPDLQSPKRSRREPVGDAERVIVAAIAATLDRSVVDVDDDFFDLGGDSISAISLVRQAQRHGLTLTLQDIFTLRTPARLAAGRAVTSPDAPAQSGEVSTAGSAAPAEPRSITSLATQHRLRLTGTAIGDHVFTEVADLPRPVGEARLREAARALWAEVDALRLRVTPLNRLMWTTEIAPPADLPVDSVSSHDRSTLDTESALRATRAQIVEGIDITAGRAVHVAEVTSAEGTHLVVAVHGLAADRRTLHRVLTELSERLGGNDGGATGPVRSIGQVAEDLAEIARSADPQEVPADVIDRLRTLSVPARPDTSGADSRLVVRTVAAATGKGEPDAAIVEAACVAAVERSSPTERAVDLEWDLRGHLADDEAGSLYGALTTVYPLITGTPPAAATDYAPWYDLLRYQNKGSRRTLQKLPPSDVLVTRHYGRTADPAHPEDFDASYRIVAAFRIDTNGVHLQVRGPDSVDKLLNLWGDELEARLHGPAHQ